MRKFNLIKSIIVSIMLVGSLAMAIPADQTEPNDKVQIEKNQVESLVESLNDLSDEEFIVEIKAQALSNSFSCISDCDYLFSLCDSAPIRLCRRAYIECLICCEAPILCMNNPPIWP